MLCRCGGTLISKSHVLTKARCTRGETNTTIKVLIGAHNISKGSNDGTRVAVSTIANDPLYDSITGQNDFSILTLAQPVTFTDTVSPACLPSDVSQDYAGQEATVVGWGRTDIDNKLQSVLQEAIVRVINNTECQQSAVYQGGHVPEYISEWVMRNPRIIYIY